MEHLTLLELNQLISDTLTKNLEASYWLVAEIGEMRQNQKGHCYLELVQKEEMQILAKSRATIWSYTYRNLSGWFETLTGKQLSSGMKILCNVTIQYHAVYGFSLNIRDIDAQYTLGERAKKRQEIIAQLQKDGIFHMNRELPLPTVPQHIAVISSESAAGFGDFIDQLETNEHGISFEVELFNSIMQGEKAETSIIASMHRVFERSTEFDLLVIIRGGGASLDLDCFDSYDLGSHIAQFPLPVVTGIGHERDETIADMVAHTKMKTPTAVAEFMIAGAKNFLLRLSDMGDKVVDVLSEKIGETRNRVDQLSYKLKINSQDITNQHNLQLNNIERALFFAYQSLYRSQVDHVEELRRSITRIPRLIVEQQVRELSHVQKALQMLDPDHVLKRGYSISTIRGINVNQISYPRPGDLLETVTESQRLKSIVQASEKK